MFQRVFIFVALILLVSPLGVCASETTLLTSDGAWCWFQDPRAVYVEGTHQRTYAQWMTRAGQLQVGALDHESGEVQVYTLEEDWDRDDHNVGAFLVLPDKRLMAFYARHNKQGLYCRTTERPEDIMAWGDRVAVSTEDKITYAHPVYLRAEKKFYVFWRGPTWKPTFTTSSDGKGWSAPQVLIQESGREAANVRPYTKVYSDGESAIHFTFTDGHPRDEAHNSVYYLHYEDGKFHKADGTVVGSMDALPVEHNDSDVVYDGASTGVRAWVWDIAQDKEDRPIIAYTRLPGETDHRYHYACWDGDAWLDTEITPGGAWFPQTPDNRKEPEPHYSGGIALDHGELGTAYLSRPVNGVFEIERWHTRDSGKTWTSEAITLDSEGLNVRPVVPRGGTGVLWMSGEYTHYTDYATGIKYAR